VVVSSLGSGVYHTKIGNSITSVKDNALAKDFNLSQNYPNPFNPSTKINYSVPVKGNVKLTVYDLLGRKVTELVNEIKPAGKYSVNFDAGELASGTYIYRLKAGNFSISRKMILVK